VRTSSLTLTLTLLALFSGCAGGPTPAAPPATTTPPPPCDGTAAGPQAIVTLIVSAPATMVSGTAANLSAIGFDAAGHASNVTAMVTWSSSNVLVASAGDGMLYGVGVGDAVIRATVGEITATADVSVEAIELVSLELRTDAGFAVAGGINRWRLFGHYSDGSAVDLTGLARWSSSDESIVAVDEPGQLRAVASGVALISAVADGHEASQPMLVQ
jgi:hypothetical protein